MTVLMFGNYALYFIPRLVALSNKLREMGSTLVILQASESNKRYGNIPEVSSEQLEIHNVYSASQGKSYKQKALYYLNLFNPDVLITGFISFPYSAIGMNWAKSHNKALIEYDDQRYDTFPRGRLNHLVKNILLSNVDAFICPAPAWDETLLKYGFSKDQIFYGLDVSDNDYWSKVKENNHFSTLPKRYFMTLGRQTKMKNLDLFLEAYKGYIADGGNIPLVMVGDGPIHNKLQNIAQNLKQVFFLGFQNRENIRDLFFNMTALVFPSTKEETWGMVVNEAMASGNIIAISEECGSATTIVKDGINGFVFNPHSIQAIKEALFKVQNLSLSERKQMENQSKEIIKEWGIPVFVENVCAACEYAIKHKKKVTLLSSILMRLWKGRYNIDNTI